MNIFEFQHPGERVELGSGAYLDMRASILARIASDVADLPAGGLSARLDAFWQSWLATADDPDDLGPRRALLQRATEVTESFNATSAALRRLAADLRGQLERSVTYLTSAESDASAREASTAGWDLRTMDGSALAQSEALAITLPACEKWLDRIAHSLADTVNALHVTGCDLVGAPALRFFSGVTAATLSVLPTTPSRVAVSATCFPDAAIARQLAEFGKASGNAGTAYRELVASIDADRQSVLARAADRRAAARRSQSKPAEMQAEIRTLLGHGRAFRAGRRTLGSVDAAVEALTTTVHPVGTAGSEWDGFDAVIGLSAASAAYSMAQQTMATVSQTSIRDFVT